MRDYATTWAALNPWMGAAARRPVGLGVVAEQMLPQRDLRRTDFYEGFLREIGCRTAAGVTVERREGRLILLSVMTSRDDPEANLPFAKTLTTLAPHLARAFAALRRSEPLGPLGMGGIERLGAGCLVLGWGGVVRTVSPLAQEIMDRTNLLSLDLRGRLRWRDDGLGARTAAMLRPDHEGTTAVTARVGSDREALRVTLARIGSDAISELLFGPTLLVLLEPLVAPEAAAHAGARAVADRFGLTRAETEVLEALALGLAVADIATARDVSAVTVRNQIKALFSKTGTRRQAELTRLVLTEPR